MSTTSRSRLGALAVGVVLALGLAAPATGGASGDSPPVPVTDPVPDPVMSDLGLVVEEYASFPKTETTPAATDARLIRHARINYIGEVPDRSGRRYVPDLNGPMYLLDGKRRHTYLDVKKEVGADFFSGRGMGSGFGFVTFDPDFKRNGRFYTVHTENGAALTTKKTDFAPQPGTAVHGVVTEWTAEDPSANTFRGTRREVLRLGFNGFIHGIQQIDFDPTATKSERGLLYLGVGDGGTGVSNDDPQDLTKPTGKILRIDPRGSNASNGRYGIPRSNPFARTDGAVGEIFAIGMRDPHRFSWDAGGTHKMLLGHIGQNEIEAVYDVRAGDDLGWSKREGTYVFDKTNRCDLFPLPADDAENGFTYPVAQYDHNPPPGFPCGADVGRAVSGGFVYRGDDLKALRGQYVFGDLVDGRVMTTKEREMRRGQAPATISELTLFTRSGTEVTTKDLAGDARVDLRFGTDARGELYLLSKANGKVWKVTGTRKVARDASVHPTFKDGLVAHWDFDHPARRDAARELDQGPSGTVIDLINAGARMRTKDGAHRASRGSVQTKQVAPTVAGNDDWKAGVYDPAGVRTLAPLASTEGVTVSGWFKMTGDGPALNSNTPAPDDRYNAIGLAGVLSGDSDGHGVRALLELINVDGELKLVALGRRLDEGRSQTFAADEDWRTLLPIGQWVHLAATFDYTTGDMALYRDGKPVAGRYTADDDPWGVEQPGEHVTSPTLPRGIKIGGSYPQDTREQNPCDCRIDDVMVLDRAVTALEVSQQHRRMVRR